MDSDLSDLMRQHMEVPFPKSVEKGSDYGLVCSVMVGADIYGWASRVAAGKVLPEIEQRGLVRLRDELVASLDYFPPEARPYYELVARIATEALRTSPELPLRSPDSQRVPGQSALVRPLDRNELIEMLDRDGAAVSVAAASALRTGALLAIRTLAASPGESFASSYRSNRRYEAANGATTDGIDLAIARLEQADTIDGWAEIAAKARHYRAYLCYETENVVVASVSTPAARAVTR